MTITVTTVSNNQSFGAWLSTTNRLANLMTSNVVTADATTTGSITTGNVVVNGYFGAAYVYVGTGLVGGNLASNGQLSILSNTLFKDVAGANQAMVLSNSTITTKHSYYLAIKQHYYFWPVADCVFKCSSNR